MRKFLLVLILVLAFGLRFYQLGTIPAGIHGDEASQAYNAFSLVKTGMDRYGQSWPVLFRSLGSYQPPLYTYLTTVSVAVSGNSILAARVVSALSGVTLVVLTFVFGFRLKVAKRPYYLGLLAAFLVAISPWSVFFSRLAVEANLGVALFVGGLVLLFASLKKQYLFFMACLLLGLSTQAYYSERLIVWVVVPSFLYLYRVYFLRLKSVVLLGILLFIVVQIPHIYTIQTGAFARRFNQVGYIESGKNLAEVFLSNYLIYFHPKNLFFDSDSGLGRTMPGLSVFYPWMMAALIAGLIFCLKNLVLKEVRFLLILLIITPLPAALTGDVFYPLRTLDYLWILTIVCSIGIFWLFSYLKSRRLIVLLTALVIVYSLFSLGVSYFVLFKFEKARYYGYTHVELVKVLGNYHDKKILVDSARDPGIGVRIAYLTGFDPNNLQSQLRSQMVSTYYSDVVNSDEVYRIDNITVSPIYWAKICESDLLVGDEVAISDSEVSEHHLIQKFEIKDLSGGMRLRGFEIDRVRECHEEG